MVPEWVWAWKFATPNDVWMVLQCFLTPMNSISKYHQKFEFSISKMIKNEHKPKNFGCEMVRISAQQTWLQHGSSSMRGKS